MSSRLEYPVVVRHSFLASVAFLSLLAFFASASHAQINGPPASVTSPGFGGRPINGAPPSVTSLGPRGFAPTSRGNFSGLHAPRSGEVHHRHHYVQYSPPLVYAVPVPYSVDIGATDDDADSSSDQDYQGGPTIFDRRGYGAESYVPPVRNAPRPHAATEADASTLNASTSDASSPDPDPPQEPTVLVFKDGRKLEVGNYAIVSQTLFDLTPGHARKIPLSELDLEATRQQNEERGIAFQLPPSSQAN